MTKSWPWGSQVADKKTLKILSTSIMLVSKYIFLLEKTVCLEKTDCLEKTPKESVVETFRNISTVWVHC